MFSFFSKQASSMFSLSIVILHACEVAGAAQCKLQHWKKLLWACLWICVHLCRNRWVPLPEWVICNNNENPCYFASHSCSILFLRTAEIILSALSKQIVFDNHTTYLVHLSFNFQVVVTAPGNTVVSDEAQRKLLKKTSPTCLPLSLQKHLRETSKMLCLPQTRPQTTPPRCSNTGVTTWDLRVEGPLWRSSVTMATTATLATASPSLGRSQIYDQTGQCVDQCVCC